MGNDKACISAVKEVCQRCHLYKENCGILDYPDQCWSSGRYIDGYRQAEQDLDFTLEDVKKIFALITDIFNERNMYYPVSPEEQEEFYQEVLKRFKEYKRQQANSCKI